MTTGSSHNNPVSLQHNAGLLLPSASFDADYQRNKLLLETHLEMVQISALTHGVDPHDPSTCSQCVRLTALLEGSSP